MNKEELMETCKKHKNWLNNDPDGVRANLSGAYLSDANLSGADLSYADLSYAYLSGANLSGADLRRTDLSGANLRNADISGAKIEDIILNKIYPITCPEYGSFIAFKKAGGKIIKLEVCEDALRSSAFSRKCRCSKAEVLAIENIDGTIAEETEIRSDYDRAFVYTVGEIVEVTDFDTNRMNECSTGIHFFITRQEAVDY